MIEQNLKIRPCGGLVMLYDKETRDALRTYYETHDSLFFKNIIAKNKD